MPELPDVEVFRKTMDKKVVNHVIEDFEIDVKKILKTSKRKLNDYKGHKATDTQRIGKYCFLKVGKSGWIVFHFGMTGYVEYREKDEKKAIKADAQPDKLPSNYLTATRDKGKNCPSCKGKIKKSTISGRSSYYCTSCQKKTF